MYNLFTHLQPTQQSLLELDRKKKINEIEGGMRKTDRKVLDVSEEI